MQQLDVLFEDNHVIAVNKPAGLATMGAADGAVSLAQQVKGYLKRKYNKPGNVYLGIVSRIDAPVTGVVVFARTSKAAARLTAMFQRREIEKRYWAILSPARLDAEGVLEHWVVKNESRRRMETCGASRSGAKQARLAYRICSQSRQQGFVEIELETGRKHQIRVQFEAIGCPIVGDTRYGSRQDFPKGIALHARQLTFKHPVGDAKVELQARLPRYWPVGEELFR